MLLFDLRHAAHMKNSSDVCFCCVPHAPLPHAQHVIIVHRHKALCLAPMLLITPYDRLCASIKSAMALLPPQSAHTSQTDAPHAPGVFVVLKHQLHLGIPLIWLLVC